MATEIREEQDMEGEEVVEPQPQKPPIQLQVDEGMERYLTDIIEADFSAAKKARTKKDYGLSSKGNALNFDDWFKGLTDLYNSRRDPKTEPWKFCSNRSLRIATSILDTMHARLLPTLVNNDLLKWNPGEVNDKPKVERITKLMNWWIWVRSELQGYFDTWVKRVCGYGDALTETSWSVELEDSGQTNEEQVVDESGNVIGVNKYRDVRPFEKTVSRSYNKDQVYLQEGSKNIQKEPVIIEETVLYRELEAGELNGQFVNVTNLLRSKLPVDMSHRGELSPEEQERYKDIEIRNTLVKIHKWYGNIDIDGDGFAEDVRVIVCLDHDVYLSGIAMYNITKSGKRPLNLTKFDNRIQNPDDNDGEGILEKVKELAEEIDAIFNQMTDANTLGLLRPGFYDPSGDLDAPALKMAPNRLIPVSDPQRNIMFPDLTIQVQQLFTAIQLVMEFIERLTAASAFVFGKESEVVGGPGTATRTNAIMQSADVRFARPAERLRHGAAQILKQHLDLLQLNIPPGLESRILGEKGDPVFGENELSALGIAGEFDAYLLPDPSLGSKQAERDLAGMFYSMLMQNPLVGTDPVKIYKVTADLIKSWDRDPEEYLGPAPELDDIDSPEDENTLVVQGDFGRVNANIAENHILHIQKHMELIQSPSLAQIPQGLMQQVTDFLQQHIMQHQQMMQLMMQIQAKFGNGGGGGSPVGGEQSRGTETAKGAPIQSGMEQAPGAIGQALDTQRKGESGPNP